MTFLGRDWNAQLQAGALVGSSSSENFGGFAAIPDGYYTPAGYMLPRKAGAMSARNMPLMAVSTVASGGLGLPAIGSSAILFTVDDAAGQLISSGNGSATFTLSTNTPLLTASLNANGSTSWTVTTNTPTLGAKASLTASATFTMTGLITPYAIGKLYGSTVDTSVLTADIVAGAVWNSVLANYQTAGTAGKSLSAASSGGVDYEALGLAVWNSVSRTLTAGAAPTVNEISAAVLASMQAAQIPVNLKAVNDVPLKGDGTAGNPWNPA